MMKTNAIRLIWICLFTFFISITIWTYAVSVDLLGLFGGIPGTENLANPKSELASEVYTSDGVLLGQYFKEFMRLNSTSKALFAKEFTQIKFNKLLMLFQLKLMHPPYDKG